MLTPPCVQVRQEGKNVETQVEGIQKNGCRQKDQEQFALYVLEMWMEGSDITDLLEEEFQPMGFFENIYFQMFQDCFNLVTTENVIVILL